MKRVILAAIIALIASVSEAQLPFGYSCRSDGDILEDTICEEIRLGMLKTGMVKSMDYGDPVFYGMLVMPLQHHDNQGVSASITVDYIDARCKPLAINAYVSIVAVKKEDLGKEYLLGFCKMIMENVSEWHKQMMPEVSRVCGSHKVLEVKLEEGK